MPAGNHALANPQIGYCTNVHAGTDMAAIRSTLEQFAVPLAAKLPTGEKLGVGLWLPASAASELWPGEGAAEFGQWLSQRRLFPFTINGFPYDNFHLPVVKHRVYQPTWAEPKRLDYTRVLSHVLAQLIAAGGQDSDEPLVGSISTLPIGWPGNDDEFQVETAGKQLRSLASELKSIEDQTGQRIVLAIEPEPGCILDRCQDVVDFFSSQLPDANHRRYMTVCHDVCHSAVMFEDQTDVLAQYAKAGVMVGKVQVSSAIDLPLDALSDTERLAAKAQLGGFAEDRYLHQTGCLDADGDFRLVEDLPLWLSSDESERDRRIRVHFHVPIFAERFGHLRTTRGDIESCLDSMGSTDAPEFSGHWEIETYAWTVMPKELRAEGLGADIERELNWFRGAIANR